MEDYKITKLSAKISDFNIDRLDFSKRIKAEHLFVSIDECILYLSQYIVCDNRINKDDLFFVSNTKTPVLYANIIDEAVCSMIYESFKFIDKKDNDLLAYNRIRVDNLKDQIIYERDKLIPNDSKRNILNALFAMIEQISIILNPVNHKEEFKYGNLSLYYYNLMYTVYSYLLTKGLETYYNSRLKSIYSKYIADLYSEYSPMGYKM